ncbi:hypothetical protein HZS_54 [Henneguya salminicola]|nr:hypothetical protein HZS_54 [Henneguya salminicola]
MKTANKIKMGLSIIWMNYSGYERIILKFRNKFINANYSQTNSFAFSAFENETKKYFPNLCNLLSYNFVPKTKDVENLLLSSAKVVNNQ